MKTSQSFGVHFTIRKGREKNGKTAVYASITINKEKVLIAAVQRMTAVIYAARRWCLTYAFVFVESKSQEDAKGYFTTWRRVVK